MIKFEKITQFIALLYMYINGQEYLVDTVSVKTRSFGPQWRPHRLTIVQHSFFYAVAKNLTVGSIT